MQNLSQLRKANLQNLTFNWQRFHKKGEIQSKTFSSAEHENKHIKHGVLSRVCAFFPPKVPLRRPIGQNNFLVTKPPKGKVKQQTSSDLLSRGSEGFSSLSNHHFSAALISHSGLYNEPTTNERSNLN